VAELGTIELPAVDALTAIIDGLAKRRAETLWEALPESYQAEATQLAQLAGTNLNRELHRAAFGTLSRINVMLKDKKGLLLPVLKSDEIFFADYLKVGLQALRTFVSAVGTSELSDPKWLDLPDLAKLTENIGGKLLAEWDLLSSALPNQDFTWAMLKEAKCELVESNDHNATVKFTIGENELQVGLEQVEGKWLPEKLVRVWPQAVISIRTFLKTPAEAASDPQLRLIELLSSINKELENLEQAESNEAFATAWAGLLAVLLPEKESAVQPPAPDVTSSVPPEIEQPEPQP